MNAAIYLMCALSNVEFQSVSSRDMRRWCRASTGGVLNTTPFLSDRDKSLIEIGS
jgi:hypothetical protein